jgi:AraC-like DNA-binding protein
LRDAGSQPPSLTQLARLLCTSPRQLRRELQSEGTSYRRLLDEVRKERALECMAGSSMTVDALARELGFQDARNFRRRFKLWTGCTPIEFRQARESLG